MAGFTKLFNSILMSSVWDESTESRIVWVTLLALADQHGHVDGTGKSLARVARVPVPACQRALDTFLGPDPMDRSGVDNGRRIRTEQGGWMITNHAMYRDRMTADERRERDRLRKRNSRQSARRPQTSEFVRDFQHTEAEAEAEVEAQEERTKNVSSEPSNGSELSAVLLTFRTIGTGGSTWNLTDAQIVAWQGAYPALDVLQECRKAEAWLEAEPTRRKTVKGMPRFLVGWLNRTVARG